MHTVTDKNTRCNVMILKFFALFSYTGRLSSTKLSMDTTCMLSGVVVNLEVVILSKHKTMKNILKKLVYWGICRCILKINEFTTYNRIYPLLQSPVYTGVDPDWSNTIWQGLNSKFAILHFPAILVDDSDRDQPASPALWTWVLMGKRCNKKHWGCPQLFEHPKL